MVKIYFLFFIIVFTFNRTPAQGQNKQSFTGIVYDASMKTPLEGATVKNKMGSETAFTNEQGRFSFQRITLESDSVVITAIGYEKITVGIKDVIDNKTTF
jgi:predicted cobalt transporter CbtA